MYCTTVFIAYLYLYFIFIFHYFGVEDTSNIFMNFYKTIFYEHMIRKVPSIFYCMRIHPSSFVLLGQFLTKNMTRLF